MNLLSTNSKLVPAICPQCSGSIEVDPSQEKAVCKYCETSFFVQKAINIYNVQQAKIERVEFMNITNNKRGAVESVLNFVEKQQEKKQQKINEEKRRQEEEKRKQEEQRKLLMNQIFNKEYRKRNLVILSLIFVVILALSIIGGGTAEESGNIAKINMPASSSDFEGKNYQDVLMKLKDAGFTNVRTEVLDDLVTGWLIKDGEVEQVKVDTYTTFSTSSSYPVDIPIVVTYHTFPQKGEGETVAIPEDNTVPEETKEPQTEVVENKVEEDYSAINQLIFDDLVQAQGWALGKLDGDGKPTENGTPSPTFAFSLYIENATYLGEKLQISVLSEFKQLSDEDKTIVINTVQNMVNVHTNRIPYTTIRMNGDVIGNSKITDSKSFTWN